MCPFVQYKIHDVEEDAYFKFSMLHKVLKFED